MEATAKAHTNIALIKYWGKRNDALILPTNNSLSVTLDGLHTTTKVTFDRELKKDQFQLNGEFIKGRAHDGGVSLLDLIRNRGDRRELFDHSKSEDAVPTAVGYASSASGFAALAEAGTKALEMDIDLPALSRITRQGSGSACRSISGGFVEWQKGEREDGTDSYAVPIAPQN